MENRLASDCLKSLSIKDRVITQFKQSKHKYSSYLSYKINPYSLTKLEEILEYYIVGLCGERVDISLITTAFLNIRKSWYGEAAAGGVGRTG